MIDKLSHFSSDLEDFAVLEYIGCFEPLLKYCENHSTTASFCALATTGNEIRPLQ
jgi:hypothetical protein